jgi:DNA-binding NarL/FixJ family response regulator
MTDKRTRVLIVDDHALIREGLRRALERSGDFEVMAEAASLAEARAVLHRHTVEVLLLDIRLSDGSGLDLAKEVSRSCPETAIVVLTMYSGDNQVLDARASGASAFVTKDTPTSDVVKIARRAREAPRDFTAPGLADVLQRAAGHVLPRLTSRESQVLELLVAGHGVAAISRRLYISESTTKTHVANIYTKLGAVNRAQAVATAIREQLVGLD